jgi:CubicO group peptidase (beta-lactamase class C family)
VNSFSVGKGILSILLAHALSTSQSSVDDVLKTHWPELKESPIGSITIKDLGGHRAGLPALSTTLPEQSLYSWPQMIASLVQQKPWWEPGTSHGYHVNTFGFLVGEVIRRATGLTVGQLIARDIAAPLHADIYLGAPDHLHQRMADFEWPGQPMAEEEPPGLTEEQLMQINTYYNPSGLSGSGVVNSPEWRRAEMPSTNMHASARGVSSLYTTLAHGGSYSGVQILPTNVLAEAVQEVSHGDDVVLGRVSRFAHGFQIPIPERGFGPNSEAFGHYGAGGSVGFCDPVAKVGFGYVMNQMGPRWQNPRNKALIEALYTCLQ